MVSKILFILAIFFAFSTCQRSGNLKSCLESKGSSDSVYVSREQNPSSNYDELNFQQNELYGTIRPLAILVVNNAADVSNAIRCSKELNIRIVAKSGGHSFGKYSSGDENSVVIDLRRLDKISVDKVSHTAEVGAGVLWANLHWELWTAGKFAFPAGLCVTLGAGTTLGGGHGILSKRFGMAADNVLEMEFVDSNGNIRIVNNFKNIDLFWALRGAGAGNFGIVTKLKYRVFKVSEKYTQLQFFFDVAKFAEILHLWDTWNSANQNGTVFTLFSTGAAYISVDIIDSGLSLDDIEKIKEYFPTPIHPVSVTTVDYVDIITKNADNAYAGKYLTNASQLALVEREDNRSTIAWTRVKSYFASETIAVADIDILSKLWVSVPDVVNIKLVSFGGLINTIRPNETAFVHRNALYYLQMGILADTVPVNQWVDEFDQIAMRVLDNGECFQNSIDGSLKNYLVRYYGSNLPKLVAIKQSVDPDNVFHHPQSIPVAL